MMRLLVMALCLLLPGCGAMGAATVLTIVGGIASVVQATDSAHNIAGWAHPDPSPPSCPPPQQGSK